MTQQMRIAKASAGRRAAAAFVIAGTLGLAGCSSVPDALNPVEWYRGTSETVGGWFGGDEPAAAEPGRGTAGDPGTSPGSGYPNLASVPPRPTPSTTAAEREALRQGLVADRTNARYTDQPAPAQAPQARQTPPPAAAPAPVQSAGRASPPPPAPEPQASVPPPAVAPSAAAAASASQRQPEPASSGERSNLWPNRPAPETPGLRASTTGKVGGGIVHSAPPVTAPEPTRASVPERRAPAATEQTASRTTLDSAGPSAPPPAAMREVGSIRAPARDAGPASAPARSPARDGGSVRAPEVSASSQSVIVNEDAIGVGAPAAASFSGRPYLASTIYFGHGSANLTGAEQKALADVARTAVSSGAAVRVIGHASGRTAELSLREHDLANFEMSLSRAQAVANVLVRAGVPANRVQVEALSDAQPEFYEVMPSGEAGNRRVEVVLIY